MKKISVSIPGGNGRMGKTLLGLIIENEKFNLSSYTCLPNEDEVGIDIGILVGKAKISKELNTDTSSLFQNSDVLIDFTVPEATMFHARKCYENNCIQLALCETLYKNAGININSRIKFSE